MKKRTSWIIPCQILVISDDWQKAILNKHYESSSQIANEVEVSSGGVRQIIRLNILLPEI